MSESKAAAIEGLRCLAAALAAEKKSRFREVVVIDGIRLVISARPEPAVKLEECADVPEVLWRESKATRRVYRFVRDFRAAGNGPERPLWPADIEAAIRTATPHDDLSNRTVHRSLKRLKGLNLVCSDGLGYRLGRHQPPLPFFGGQSDPPSPAEKRA